jgi:hypothetical protein
VEVEAGSKIFSHPYQVIKFIDFLDTSQMKFEKVFFTFLPRNISEMTYGKINLIGFLGIINWKFSFTFKGLLEFSSGVL